MTEAYIGLGSNLGDKVGLIKSAVAALKNAVGIEKVETGILYRTAPVGVLDQDWFINTAVKVSTSFSCRELLELCLEIEQKLKRVRKERWGPRTIDLDVLLYGEERVLEEGLEVPHPRMKERAFVLAPLADFDADLKLGEETVGECLARVGDDGVERLLPLDESETVAILGASVKEERYSNRAQKLLMSCGHSVVPVAPVAKTILGVDCYQRLRDYREKIDTVTLYVGPGRSVELIDEVIEARPRRVLFNPGTESTVFEKRLRGKGILAEEACTLVLLQIGSF